MGCLLCFDLRDGCSDLSLLLLWLFFFCVLSFFPFLSLTATQIFSASQNFAQLFGSHLEQFTCFLCCSLREKLPIEFQPDSCSQNSCGTIPRLSCHSGCVVFWEEDFLHFSYSFSSDIFCFTSSPGSRISLGH